MLRIFPPSSSPSRSQVANKASPSADDQEANGLARMKPVVYKDPRPAELFDRFHRRARKQGPDTIYFLIRLTLRPWIRLIFRLQITGREQVPASGPIIIAPNHASFADHFLVAAPLKRRVQYMAKSQLFTRPMQWVLWHAGAFPVRRGYHDEEAFITATNILAAGRAVAMYCEGGRMRSGKMGQAKRGIGRLALESGAQIVPTAIYGSAQVRNWKRLQFPKIAIRYGQPLTFARIEQPTAEEEQAVADEILAAVRQLMIAIALERGESRDV